MNAEFLKLRTVRAPYALLGAIGAMMLFGAVVSWLMVRDYDSAPDRLNFAAADNSVLVTPFTQFCVAALGALVVTSEYATGMIRTALTAVPDRILFLRAKILVTAVVSAVIGLVAMTFSFTSSWVVMGDRPPPIAPWDSVGDLLPSALASAASIVVAGLLGLGLGLVLRSSAGTLVCIAGLLWALPAVTPMLPAPWGDRMSSVMLPYLVSQVAETVRDAPLGPVAAAVVMAAYPAVALCAGTVTLLRRDA